MSDYHEDDSALASSVGGGFFGNDEPTEEQQEALSVEREAIIKLLPTAQEQVDDINREVARVNKLTDFIDGLPALPTDLTEDNLRAKMEARFGYINYLLMRKSAIINGLASINQEVDDVPPQPFPITKPITRPTPAAPKQTFFARLRWLFGGSPM